MTVPAFQIEIPIVLPDLGDVVVHLFPREDEVWLVGIQRGEQTSRLSMWVRGHLFHSSLSERDRCKLEHVIGSAVEDAMKIR